jgi:hypothetical protein
MESSARFVVVLLLRHSGLAAAELSEKRDRLFAVIFEPIDTYAVVGVGVLRDLEHNSRPVVVKFWSARVSQRAFPSIIAWCSLACAEKSHIIGVECVFAETRRPRFKAVDVPID